MVPRLQDSHLLWYNEGEKTKYQTKSNITLSFPDRYLGSPPDRCPYERDVELGDGV